MFINKIFKNPVRIIAATITLCLLVGFIGAPIADAGHSGGEQAGLTFFATIIHATWYITPAVAVITLFFFRDWVKKYWYKNAIITAIGVAGISADIVQRNEVLYDSDQEPVTIKGITWQKITQSYDSAHIRSISFMLNDKKDSIWTTYNKDGSILKQERYKDDKLIERIK